MGDVIKKACEITDAKISFVSLVDKAANKRQFLIAKAENGMADWKTIGRIIKADNHYVTGIVYEPLVEDAHGDFMTAEEIQKAAYWFAKNGNDVDIQHNFTAQEGISVVENWVAKADFDIDGETIRKGTWLITAEVSDNEVWDKIQKGEITGFSMGGQGKYSEEDIDLDSLKKNEKQGLLSRLAKALGFKAVVKGDVAELFEQRSKRDLFWNAVNALEDCLYRFDWNTEKSTFENDEARIRECLSDFNNIITDLLTTEKIITKAIAPDFKELEKAGKKMSGKNKETLCGIYDSLGAFLKEFDDPESQGDSDDNKNPENISKEETEMTKDEIVALIQENITKALEGKDNTPKPTEVEKSAAQITPEAIAEMVGTAVSKALEPKQETFSIEQVQQMIDSAVEKAMEPIRKQAGIPTNLNGTGQVEKQEGEHYLHGIL